MENYLMINGNRTELTEEQLKQLGIEQPKQERWRADKGEKFYFVNSYLGVVERTECNNSGSDDYLYNARNYFKTERRVKKYQRVLETEMLLKKYADEHNEPMVWDKECGHHGLEFDLGIDDIKVSEKMYTKSPRLIYFSSGAIARNAIKEIGKGRVLEYLKYEW